MTKEVSERLVRTHMAEADIRSVAELSRRSRVSRPKIYNLMRRESPYQPALVRVAEALGVSPEQLIISAQPEGDSHGI